MATAAIEHRSRVLAGSFVFLALGVLMAEQLKSQFFPDDVQYWATVDVCLRMELGVCVRRRCQTSGPLPKEFGSQIRQPLAAPKINPSSPMSLHSAGKSQVNPELLASTSIQKRVGKETYESDFARAKPKS